MRTPNEHDAPIEAVEAAAQRDLDLVVPFAGGGPSGVADASPEARRVASHG